MEQAASLFAETEDGTVLTLEVSWALYDHDDHHYVRVMGSDGTGVLPPLQLFKQLGGRPMDVTPRQPLPRGGENPFTNAYRRQIDHFLRTVCGEASCPPPREQIAVMAAVQGAYVSASEGREFVF